MARKIKNLRALLVELSYVVYMRLCLFTYILLYINCVETRPCITCDASVYTVLALFLYFISMILVNPPLSLFFIVFS